MSIDRASPSPDIDRRIREMFAAQPFMTTIGAHVERVALGEVLLALPFRNDLTQHDGFLHAGIVTTMLDNACGCAAFTQMAEGARVLSVEFKVNLLAPALGERFLAHGRVIKAGRTLTVCESRLIAFTGDREERIAMMVGTMIAR